MTKIRTEQTQISDKLESPSGLINGTTLDTSAVFQVDSTDKGVLLPRITTAQRNAISTPAPSLIVYDIDENAYYYYNGTTWEVLGNGALTPIDTVATGWAQVSGILSPTFTLYNGTNRIVILGIGTDNTTPNALWSDVKYDGISMRHIPTAYLTWGNNSMDFYFMLERDLIGISDGYPHSVTITFVNTPAASNIGFVWGIYSNVNQTNAFETIHTIADMSNNPQSITIQNCSINDDVIGLGFDDFDIGTFTVTAPFVEHPRATFSTARLAFADRTATATSHTCQYTSSNGPGIGIIGFGLRGLNK